MAVYSTDIELGVTTGVDLIAGLDAYAENISNGSVGDSVDDVSTVITGNNLQLTTNTGSITARNLSYFCSTFESAPTGGLAAQNAYNNSSPALFENCNIHIGAATAVNLFIPMTLTNVNILNPTLSADDGGTNFNWGIFGNGSGTYATLTADGHIDTNAALGTLARGTSRPFNWTNVNVFGRGGMQMLINGARPGASSFTNVNFNPAPGRGAFGELPFLPFADATWGQFYRPDFPSPGDLIWARLTGGMDRNDIDIATNWMIQPQWNIVNLDGQTAQVAVDGRNFTYFVNMVKPADVSNLTLRGGQGTQSASTGQNGPTRIIDCYGWNPVINKQGGVTTNDVKYVWDDSNATGFQIQTVPPTFTGGNTDGTAVQPADFTSGSSEPANFNGFFIIQTDTGSLISNTLVSGDTVEQYTTRSIRVFSYDTQVNTIQGTTFNQNFGRAIAATPNANNINADLTWREVEQIDEEVDVFLNGVPRTTTFNVTSTDLDQIYPMLKSLAYSDERDSENRFRIVPSEGGLRFLADVTFATNIGNDISATSGAFTIRLQEVNCGATLVNSLNFVTAAGTGDHSVQWGAGNNRTFAGPITITGGVHANFPRDWSNGLTFGAGETEIARPGVGDTLDWANVDIPDGATVRFPGTDAFSISGLTTAEQARVTGSNVTFVAAPVINTLRIPARAGFLAVRIASTEAVAPRTFTSAEITAGQAEFTLSDLTSPDGSAFSNLSDGASVEIYVKYDSLVSATVENAVYLESFQTRTYDINTPNAILTANEPTTLTTVLVGNAVPTPNGVGFVGSQTTQNRVQFLVSGANSDNANVPGGRLTNFQSQGLAIEIANHIEYFNSWYNNRTTTTTPIVIYPVAAAQWDPSRIIFGSGNTEPFTQGSQTVNIPVQQEGSDWDLQVGTSGALYLRGAGVNELNFPPSLQASLNTVAQAAAVGLDNSATAGRVQNAERGVGYLASNGNATTPSTTDSRLVGIKPKNANYNPNTSYEDIL